MARAKGMLCFKLTPNASCPNRAAKNTKLNFRKLAKNLPFCAFDSFIMLIHLLSLSRGLLELVHSVQSVGEVTIFIIP